MGLLKSLGSSVAPLHVLGGAVLLGMVLLLFRRTRRLARFWLVVVAGIYVLMGLPVVATSLARGLPAYAHAPTTQPVRALIVLDGDNRRGRLSETLRILRQDAPESVSILGDVWFIDELEAGGHPRGRFHHETSPANTREQIDWTARFVAEHPGTLPTLIASRLQAPRVAALADAAGLTIALVASPIDDEPPAKGWRAWVPSYVGFRTSRDAIYEHLALWWYRRNGWID